MIDKAKYREAGITPTQKPLILGGRELGVLMDEGWRFVFDEVGRVIAFVRPSIASAHRRLLVLDRVS